MIRYFCVPTYLSTINCQIIDILIINHLFYTKLFSNMETYLTLCARLVTTCNISPSVHNSYKNSKEFVSIILSYSICNDSLSECFGWTKHSGKIVYDFGATLKLLFSKNCILPVACYASFRS